MATYQTNTAGQPVSGENRDSPVPASTPRMLSHLAYATPDAKATADFYVNVMKMELVNGVMDDSIPSTGDDIPYFHIFFRLGDGSTIAFFEAPGLPGRASVSHPAYHI